MYLSISNKMHLRIFLKISYVYIIGVIIIRTKKTHRFICTCVYLYLYIIKLKNIYKKLIKNKHANKI